MLKVSSGIRRLDRITFCTSAIKYRADIFVLSDLSKNCYEPQAIFPGPHRYVHARHHHQHQDRHPSPHNQHLRLRPPVELSNWRHCKQLNRRQYTASSPTIHIVR
jgi:hypothetical protein